MKTLALFAVLSLGALACQEVPKSTTPSDQEARAPAASGDEAMPKPPAPTEQHVWLQQLVGEWTVSSEMWMGPDIEPMKTDSTESVRAIGGLWVVSEGKATFFGQPFTSVMTLGYDETERAFVGTWIDTMQAHLWHYRGSLDEAKKTLTLEAEGPSIDDPTKMAKYRDAITLESKDHKVHTSSLLGADGKWIQFLKADCRRKR